MSSTHHLQIMLELEDKILQSSLSDDLLGGEKRRLLNKLSGFRCEYCGSSMVSWHRAR